MARTSTDRTPLLEMQSIGKSFPGVRALRGVDFDVYAGEIHALVGENGAGKSTLMKILGGVYPQYDGEIRIQGEVKHFRSVHESESAGVAVVFQELSLVHEMTVGENIFLGREPSRFGIVQWSELYAQSEKLMRDLGLDVDPRAQVGQLGTGQQQLAEIAKALSQKASILVLDEPTAALTNAEAEKLFAILSNLRAQGIAMIYISHRLEEVLSSSDRTTILRDGQRVTTDFTNKLSVQQVIAGMVGREVSQVYPNIKRVPKEVVLEV